jgi:rod shape-determining protein MreD
MTIALNILIFAVAIYLQTSFLARFDIFGFAPSAILVLMLSFALFRRVYESYVFAFFSGLVLDIVSGGPFGFYTAMFMLIVFVSSLAVDEDHTKISNISAGIFIIIASILFYGGLLSYIFISINSFSFSGLYFSFMQAIFTIGLFVLTFPWLKRLFLWEDRVDKLRSR